MLGDLTINVDLTRVSLDLDSLHAVVELNPRIVVLDDNLFRLEDVRIFSQTQAAVVGFNDVLGDVSVGLPRDVVAEVVHDQRRVIGVRFFRVLEPCGALSEGLIDDLSAWVRLKHLSELGVNECVASEGRLPLDLEVLIVLHNLFYLII